MSLVDYQSSSESSDDGAEIPPVKDIMKQSLGNLPKPKEPVKITLPSLDEFDEEDDKPTCKKPKLQGFAGLLSMLPAPKYSRSSGKPTLLVPHVISKMKAPQPSANVSHSKKTHKPVTAKSLPCSEKEVGNSEEVQSVSDGDFFSLGETSAKVAAPTYDMPVMEDSVSTTFMPRYETGDSIAEDSGIPKQVASMKPDEYRGNTVSADSTSGASNYEYSDANVNPTFSLEEPTQSDHSVNMGNNIVNDEGFLRLQGKKMRRLEEVNIVDISADSLVADRTEWHTKSLTQEQKVTHSRKKNDTPTQVQKRKHQITYLAFQAKERELDLKNQWAQNRLTKQQTQSKYGF